MTCPRCDLPSDRHVYAVIGRQGPVRSIAPGDGRQTCLVLDDEDGTLMAKRDEGLETMKNGKAAVKSQHWWSFGG